jgi:putative endonuclease
LTPRSPSVAIAAVSDETWHVYLIRRADGALYTGIATEVERRLAEHREGRGAKSLRGRGPLDLVAQHPVGELGQALRVEHRIKRLTKAAKEELLTRDGRLAGLVDDARQAEAS